MPAPRRVYEQLAAADHRQRQRRIPAARRARLARRRPRRADADRVLATAARRRSRSSRRSSRSCCGSSRAGRAGPRRRGLARDQRHADADGASRRRALLRNAPAGRHRHRPPGRRHPRPSSRANVSSRRAKRTLARAGVVRRSCAPPRERGVSLAPPPRQRRHWCAAGSSRLAWPLDNSRNPTLGATRLAAFRARYPVHPALAALSGEPG